MGFPLSLFLEWVDSSLLCTVCWEVLEDPIVGACGHAYCHKCINAWFMLGNQLCPGSFHCSNVGTQLTPATGELRQRLDGLVMHCSFGCKFTFKLGEYWIHISDCKLNTTETRLCTALVDMNRKLYALNRSTNQWLLYTQPNCNHRSQDPQAQRHCSNCDMRSAFVQVNENFRQIHYQARQVLMATNDESVTRSNSNSSNNNNGSNVTPPSVPRRPRCMNELVDKLTEEGHIRIFRIAYVMRSIDRSYYVETQPYDDVWQTEPVLVRPPRDDALILETLTYHLPPGAKVLKIGCVSNFLTVCICVMVGNLGHVMCYESNPRKLRRFMDCVLRERPALLETKNMEAYGMENLGALHYYRESFDAIVVEKDIGRNVRLAFGALKRGGRMMMVNRTDRKKWQFHDKLLNGRIRSNTGFFN